MVGWKIDSQRIKFMSKYNGQAWNTKYGPRRVRHDAPTLEEAIAAARDLSDELNEQAEIAASLMGLPYEEVHVWNVTRGTRFRTYAMTGEIGSGVVCANGAAALLVEPGDLVIIATFTTIEDSELEEFRPKIVFVDENNTIRSVKTEELAGPHTIY